MLIQLEMERWRVNVRGYKDIYSGQFGMPPFSNGVACYRNCGTGVDEVRCVCGLVDSDLLDRYRALELQEVS
jgi:hypothetical protein